MIATEKTCPSPFPLRDPHENLSKVAVIVYVDLDLVADLDADVVAVVCLDESTA